MTFSVILVHSLEWCGCGCLVCLTTTVTLFDGLHLLLTCCHFSLLSGMSWIGDICYMFRTHLMFVSVVLLILMYS